MRRRSTEILDNNNCVVKVNAIDFLTPDKDDPVPKYLHMNNFHKFKWTVSVQPPPTFSPFPAAAHIFGRQMRVRAPQPSPPTAEEKKSFCRRPWLSCLRRGSARARLWPWPADGSELPKGPSSSAMAACKFLISPTNALVTPTQRAFPRPSPTGEILPAALLLRRANLWWLDAFHGRAAWKQQKRQVSTPGPLSSAALFWFDFFFSFFCLL